MIAQQAPNLFIKIDTLKVIIEAFKNQQTWKTQQPYSDGVKLTGPIVTTRSPNALMLDDSY